MIRTVVFDSKPYDRESLEGAAPKDEIEWQFMEFRLRPETAPAAGQAEVVCIFVNDHADRPGLEALASLGVKHIALRCAGFKRSQLGLASPSRACPLIGLTRWRSTFANGRPFLEGSEVK